MSEIEGYTVRHLPCGHERFIEAPSVELALRIPFCGLLCIECDDGLPREFEVVGPKGMGRRAGLDD